MKIYPEMAFYIGGGLYESLGAHCDDLGLKLAKGITDKGYRMAYEPESNMIFPVFSAEKADELAEKVMFERWEDHGDEQVIRLVTNWSSTQQDIEDFLALI
jgi:threonine aldolase